MDSSQFSWLLPYVEQLAHLFVEHIWTLIIGGGVAFGVATNYGRFLKTEYGEYILAREYANWARRARLKLPAEARSDFKSYFLELVKDIYKHQSQSDNINIDSSNIDKYAACLRRSPEVWAAFEDFKAARDTFLGERSSKSGNSNILHGSWGDLKLSWLRFFDAAFEPHTDKEFERFMNFAFFEKDNPAGADVTKWRYRDVQSAFAAGY